MRESGNKKVVIIGAGPAGLTAAYELLSMGSNCNVIVIEESAVVGGISKTVNYKGNRMDMGGHRLFSKSPEINEWWEKMMPMQGEPSKDDILLDRYVPLTSGGPDPEKEDVVMLNRHRVSRIFFEGKFYDYPISMKIETIKNLGLINTLKCGFSYIGATIKKRPETNLENYYINSFGKRLYSMFFEYYTENLWGRHPRDIDASWGAQRTKGLSISGIIKSIFMKSFNKTARTINTSLIEQFKYPKLGPGELWEVTADKIEKLGGEIIKNAKVTKIFKEENCITSVAFIRDGIEYIENGDVFISSMPLKDLIEGMYDVPEDVLRIAEGLPYRDYITLGVLVKKLKIQNETNEKTIDNIIPDCWVYVQDRNVKMGRFQVYNNWSPYMVKDLNNTVWLGLEYFCNEGDSLWEMSESEFVKMGVEELKKTGIIQSDADVIDTHLEKVKKAYPAYFGTYNEMDDLIKYLDTFDNLYCVGRNGQHRYNNIDHSMMTSIEAVRCINTGCMDKKRIWNVNIEHEYHESKG